MKKIILAALLFATPAFAQEITLKVTNEDVNMIGKGLGKLPFDDVASLIQKLRNQIVEQQAKQEAPKVEEKK